MDYQNLSELRTALESKKVSSVEIVTELLAREAKLKSLNCFLECSAERVLAEAKIADQKRAAGERGALLGIPIAVKDMILTKGVKTTAASKMLENFIPPYDAAVVEKLKAAGAIMFGKTNLDEFAMGGSNEYSAFGVVRNPWNKEFVPGGSSGGSAAAVSAGIVPGALGTDTGGSVRQPASFCSVVGCKPTYGRVSRYGVVAFASSLDQVGTFTRSVGDCAELTELICGHDPRDATSVEKPAPSLRAQLGKGVKGLRIGLPKEYFVAGLDSEVAQAVRTAVKKFEELGAKVVDISLPHTELGVATYYIIAPAEASSNLARYDGIRYGHRTDKAASLQELYGRSRSEGFGPEPKRRILIGSYVLSAGYYDAFYLKAQRVRSLVVRDFKEAFASQCDIIACPTSPTPPFKIGEKSNDPVAMYLTDAFTIPVNLAGLPGLSMPCGFTTSKLPIGLQLIGKPWDETTLFNAASAYEQATEWHKQTPSL